MTSTRRALTSRRTTTNHPTRNRDQSPDSDYGEPQQESQQNPRTKMDKMIKEIDNGNPTREQIAILIMEYAQRGKINFDFKLTKYLDTYMSNRQEVNFPEAGIMIYNSGIIYGKRVELMHQNISNAVAESGKEAEEVIPNPEKPPAVDKRKKSAARPMSLHDSLYEAPMTPKKFKQLPVSKTTETESNAQSFEPPENYFSNWQKYKDWRTQHKKKMKSPIPYSIICDDTYIHSDMWRLSRIEDFDYDDDSETKRNFRMFTNYLEHRYSTLVPDVNFIMHFKVKDFIEAEEDEIEIMKALGLPAPPTRNWPPFCKTTYSKEYVKQHYNVSLNDNESYDYIHKYIAVEDMVLEHETTGGNPNFTRVDASKKLQLQKSLQSREKITGDDELNIPSVPMIGGDSITTDVDETPGQDLAENLTEAVQNSENSTVADDNAAPIEGGNPANPVEINKNLAQAQKPEEVQSLIEELPAESIDKTTVHPSIPESSTNSPIEVQTNSVPPETTPAAPDTAVTINSEEATATATVPTLLTENILTASTSSDQQTQLAEDSPAATKKSANELPTKDVPKSTDENDRRPSIDEGISTYFSDLDDLDRDMLNPVVELVDILKPVQEIDTETSFLIDMPFRNIFAIDEEYLRFEQNFSLPFDVVYREPPVVINILGLPKQMLKRRGNFSLPSEFDLFKKDRCKRKTPMPVCPRKIKLFKLNETNLTSNDFSAPPTPEAQDFLGFSDSSFDGSDFERGNLLSSTLNEIAANKSSNQTAAIGENVENLSTPSSTTSSPKIRTISNDSGIVVMSSELLTQNSENLTGLNGTPSFLRGDSGIDTNSLPLEPKVEHIDVDKTRDIIQLPPISDISEVLDLSANNGNENSTEALANQDKNDQNSDEIERLTRKMLGKKTAEEIIDANNDQIVQKKVCNELIEQRIIEMNQIIERVQNWHRYLKPILAQSSKRHYFDFYALGTEIINKFPKQDDISSMPSINLKRIMADKDPSYISRYFLSTLQLANSNNVQINVHRDKQKAPVPIENVSLTLLNKQRHSIAAEDNAGAQFLSRKRTHSMSSEQAAENDNTLSTSQDSSQLDLSEQQEEATDQFTSTPIFIKRHEENMRKSMAANREALSKEVNEHRDKYIKLLSRKHDINLEMFFSSVEIERVESTETPAIVNFCTISVDPECSFSSQSMRVNTIQSSSNKRSRICDDLDSGFFSTNNSSVS